jgi:hypothetical protein
LALDLNIKKEQREKRNILVNLKAEAPWSGATSTRQAGKKVAL